MYNELNNGAYNKSQQGISYLKVPIFKNNLESVVIGHILCVKEQYVERVKWFYILQSF